MAQALTLPNPRDGLAGLWRAYPRETVGFGLLGLRWRWRSAAPPIRHPSFRTGAGRAARPAAAARPPDRARTGACSQPDDPDRRRPQPGRPAVRLHRQFRRPAPARSNASPARSITKPGARMTTASARSPRWSSTGSVIRPSRPASATSSTRARPARPAASSPSPATARSIAGRMSPAGTRAYRIAQAALSGSVYAPVGYATHYHANYVVPYWASTLAKNAVVGAHIFYRWAGGWGRPTLRQGLFGPRAQRRCAAQRRDGRRGRDRQPGRQRITGRSPNSWRRSAPADPVDARRQARRDPLQPGRSDGVRRRRTTTMSSNSRRPTICAGRCRTRSSPPTRSRSARPKPAWRRDRGATAGRWHSLHQAMEWRE